MKQEFEGRAITVLRNAQSGDEGFDADKHHQLFVRFEDDASERAVNKDYVRTLQDGPAERMQFEGFDVTVMREAEAGDTGFVQGAPHQVLIKLMDGSEIAVTRAELKSIAALRPGDAPRGSGGDAEHAMGKTGPTGGLPVGPVTLDGVAVSVVRAAARGDQGFDEEKPSQILVRTGDGAEMVVSGHQLQAVTTGHVNQSDTQHAGAAGHADAHDAPQQMQFEGADVTVERDARDGDEGFDARADQVLISTADGTRKAVHRNDVQAAQAA